MIPLSIPRHFPIVFGTVPKSEIDCDTSRELRDSQMDDFNADGSSRFALLLFSICDISSIF
jgi:hypothetical protein